jgi:hypothetical protein
MERKAMYIVRLPPLWAIELVSLTHAVAEVAVFEREGVQVSSHPYRGVVKALSL